MGMHAILELLWFLKRRGLCDCKKKGVCLSHIKSGIYNSVKYGLKGMRYKNANMYVAHK